MGAEVVPPQVVFVAKFERFRVRARVATRPEAPFSSSPSAEGSGLFTRKEGREQDAPSLRERKRATSESVAKLLAAADGRKPRFGASFCCGGLYRLHYGVGCSLQTVGFSGGVEGAPESGRRRGH